ncbi:hypothetical protein ACFYO2_38105 [Streptomyces sp. NPDC006602]
MLIDDTGKRLLSRRVRGCRAVTGAPTMDSDRHAEAAEQ